MKSLQDDLLLEKKSYFVKIILRIVEMIRIFFNNFIEFPIILFFYEKKRNKNNDEKLLLINTGDLGDNVLTFNFLIALNDSGLFNTIHLLVKDSNCQIYQFLKPQFKILQWNKRKYKYNLIFKIKFIKKLKAEKYNTVFNITPERGILNEELTLVSGAKRHWKINKESQYISPVFVSYFNRKYEKNYRVNLKNEYEILDEIIGQLMGVEKSLSNEKNVCEKKHEENFIVIAPLPSDSERGWGLINYIELAKKLSKQYNVYFVGTEKQFSILQNQKITDSKIKNICGQLKLNEIPTFIRNARLFIGNDSGLTHLAIFLKIPLIAIIGGGMFGRFFPYDERDTIKYFSHKMECFGCNWKCLYRERYCLTRVSVDDVLKESYGILKKHVT